MRLGFTRREWLLIGISVALLAAWWADRWNYGRSYLALREELNQTKRELKYANSDTKIAQAVFGSQPIVQLRPVKAQPKTPFEFQLNYENLWVKNSGLEIDFVWDVKEVRLDGKRVEVKQRVRSSEYVALVCEHDLEPGDHEVSVDVESGYIKASKSPGVDLKAGELWSLEDLYDGQP